ncbi:hypothetical protein FJY93_04555 [Candidatus Kaiserbacteria bacterium]|nr:hypothetical protein [Candidatus Kaiserbacteria bacterium]
MLRDTFLLIVANVRAVRSRFVALWGGLCIGSGAFMGLLYQHALLPAFSPSVAGIVACIAGFAFSFLIMMGLGFSALRASIATIGVMGIIIPGWLGMYFEFSEPVRTVAILGGMLLSLPLFCGGMAKMPANLDNRK